MQHTPDETCDSQIDIEIEKMTPEMAADYLLNAPVVLRSFAEALTEMYPSPDLIPRLTDFSSPFALLARHRPCTARVLPQELALCKSSK